MEGLIKRMITAGFFVGIMLAGLYGGRLTFVLLFGIIAAISLWEFFGIVLDKVSRRDRLRKFLGMLLGLMPIVLATILQLGLAGSREAFLAVASLLFAPAIFLSFVYELYTQSEKPFVNIAFVILGMVYIGVPFSLLEFIAFNGEHFYADIVLGLLLLSWANDTGAYLSGSRWGKTPLFQRISPKKTWEGSIGGALITFVIAAILAYFFKDLTLTNWLILAAIIIVFGTLGDLVESMLKRSQHLKDSGTIMPGHGGLLDRFDGFIFMLPYVAAYLLLVR
ncbi:MAG: phosphatidate cytidylyltransferase [Lewinellaceae bacterium]|nr:phosphatidate cytidylyltransferase [Lewinella sp.]MCB9282121.1 phosphatidate cytidylyltransferase [Lewinellaceae bacterium]